MRQSFSFLILFFCVFFAYSQDIGGTVFLMGGAISDNSEELYNSLKSCSNSANPKIAVFCSGAKNFASASDAYYNDYTDNNGVLHLSYCHVFEKYGFSPVFIPIALDNYTVEAYKQENVILVNSCEIAFFNGGDQSRHARVLLNNDGSDTPLMAAVRNLYNRGGTVAGTSAGNAVQAKVTYGEGNSIGYLYHNRMAVKKISDISLVDPNDPHGHNGGFSQGFGFLTDTLCDTHFDARGRLGRMIVALRETKYSTAVGVDENTAFLVKNGIGKAVGQRGVFIADASSTRFGSGSYFSAVYVLVHYLTSQDTYNFTTKTVVSSKPLITTSSITPQNSSHIFGAYETTRVITELASSSKNFVYGETYDPDHNVPIVFYLTFQKDNHTKGYYEAGKYTISGLLLEIEY